MTTQAPVSNISKILAQTTKIQASGVKGKKQGPVSAFAAPTSFVKFNLDVRGPTAEDGQGQTKYLMAPEVALESAINGFQILQAMVDRHVSQPELDRLPMMQQHAMVANLIGSVGIAVFPEIVRGTNSYARIRVMTEAEMILLIRLKGTVDRAAHSPDGESKEIDRTDSGDIPVSYANLARRVVADLVERFRWPTVSTGDITRFADFAKIEQGERLACKWAQYLFGAGRGPTEKSKSMIDKRAKNLVDKFAKGREWPEIYFQGSAISMSIEMAKAIADTWDMMPELRSDFFSPMIDTARHPKDVIDNIVATMVNLLQFAQMQHVKLILLLFEKHPWLDQMPSLRNEIQEMVRSTATWQEYPERERVFIKLLRRDAFKAFDSKQLSQLTALAKERLGQDTLVNYVAQPLSPEVSDEFGRYYRRNEVILEEEEEEDDGVLVADA